MTESIVKQAMKKVVPGGSAKAQTQQFLIRGP